jgi:hypothetical protein
LAALSTGAPTYAFGLYGATLKRTLHLTQSELNTVSSANFCAGLLSWIPGLCVDRWGEKKAICIGGSMQSIMLISYWYAAKELERTNADSVVSVIVLSCLGFILFMSNSLVIGSLFKAIVISCDSGKGAAVGAAKGFVGLGSGVYAMLFDAVRSPDMSDLGFLPMASIMALLFIVLPSALLLPSKENQCHIVEVASARHFRIVYLGLFLLGILVVGTSVVFLFEPVPDDSSALPSSDEPSLLRACLILAVWLGPIMSIFFLPQCDAQKESFSEVSLSEADFLVSKTPPSPCADEDLSLTQMLRTSTAWMICWTCTILVGSGTLLTNNMGQEVEARRFPARTALGCLALFSVSQSIARVATGEVSELALYWKINGCGLCQGIPRPAFFILSSAVAVAAHSLLAVASSRGMFALGVASAGYAFGMVWPLMVLIVGEIFGTTNHGANYLFYDGCTSAVGTLAISRVLASAVYEAHIDFSKRTKKINACFGQGCFWLSHVVTAVLAFTSIATSVVVLMKTRNVYDRPSITQSMRRRSTNDLYGSPFAVSRKSSIGST